MRPKDGCVIITTCLRPCRLVLMVGMLTHNHSGRRLSCAFISLIVRPVWSVSIIASSGIRSSSRRASFVRTLDRWIVGALDHAPDWKASCASSIASFTNSSDADATLFETTYANRHGTGHAAHSLAKTFSGCRIEHSETGVCVENCWVVEESEELTLVLHRVEFCSSA